MSKNFLHKKWVGVSFLLIAVVGLSLPFVSHAAFWDVLTPSGLITSVFKGLAYIFNFIFGLLFMLAAWLVEVMMQLNSTVLDPAKNTIVGIGWPIARDIANLGFVIVMIIIAVATIVRYREYGAKQLLPKLIAAAIIVNFSLTIMAAFVNFSNVVTNFFVSAGGEASGGYTMTGALADAFGPQKFLIEDQDPTPPDPEEEVGSFTSLTTGVLSSLAGLFFTVIFTLLAAFVFLAFAFLLLLRFLYLTFLAILSPLVWLFWVFPPLRSQYSKWWSKFISWTFFAPAASFFMYLALASVKGLAEKSFAGNASSAYFGAGIIGGVMQQGVQMIIVAGVMIGGLLIAEKMGITGATAMANIARGAGNGLRKYAGARTMQGLQGIASSAVASRIPSKVPFVGGKTTADLVGAAGTRLQKMGKGFEIKQPEYEIDATTGEYKLDPKTGQRIRKSGDGFLARVGKRTANIATMGFREPVGMYGGMLSSTEEGARSLASREKIKAGSLMGTMLSGAGEKSGFGSKKETKEKEPLKQSEKEKNLKGLTTMQQQGVIKAPDLHGRRIKTYSELDAADAPLIENEIKTLSAERKIIAKNLADEQAKGSNANKDKIETFKQNAKYNQMQQEALVGKVQDEKTAENILQSLHADRAANYDPSILDSKVLGSHISKLQQKLESQKAIENELARIDSDRTVPNVDHISLNQQTANLQKQVPPQNSDLIKAQLISMDSLISSLSTQIASTPAGLPKEKLEEARQGAVMLRGQLQDKIRDNDTALAELSRIYSSTAYPDNKERDIQLRKVESKLEGKEAIKKGLDMAHEERRARESRIESTPSTDTKAVSRLKSENADTDRRIQSLTDRYGEELGKAGNLEELKQREKEYEELRKEHVTKRYNTSALDGEIADLRSRIRKEEDIENKRWGVERIWEDKEKELQETMDEYTATGRDTSGIEKNIEVARETRTKLGRMQKKVQGESGWKQRITDLDAVAEQLNLISGMIDPNNSEHQEALKEISNLKEQAQEELRKIKKEEPKKTESEKTPKSPAPQEPGYKKEGSLYVPIQSIQNKKEEPPTTPTP